MAMIGRVTQQAITASSVRNLQQSLGRTATLQEQLSSGKVISKPSDDPAGLVDAMRIRSEQRANVQHARNAENGEAWLTTVDSALTTSSTLLINARDLVVRGASTGSLSQTGREAIALELEALADALVGQANTTYLGRPVFAGSSSASEAFDPTTFTWNGTPGTSVDRRVSENLVIQVDADGAAAFGEGATSVFQTLKDAATAIRTGQDGPVVAAYLSTIDGHHDALLKEIGSVGTRHNQIMTASTQIEETKGTLSTQRSAVEDIDMAETFVDLSVQQVAYQAALSATQQALQPSLLDFLR